MKLWYFTYILWQVDYLYSLYQLCFDVLFLFYLALCIQVAEWDVDASVFFPWFLAFLPFVFLHFLFLFLAIYYDFWRMSNWSIDFVFVCTHYCISVLNDICFCIFWSFFREVLLCEIIVERYWFSLDSSLVIVKRFAFLLFVCWSLQFHSK